MARPKRMTTRQGIRLWTIKQAPLYQVGASAGVPTYDFDPSNVTFTPKLAKRTAPGPYAAAPIVQDKWIPTGSTPDVLSLSRGTVIDGEFYDNMDGYQGAINVWITPEWDGDDGKFHNIYTPFGPTTIGLYKYTDNKLYIQLGVRFHGFDISAWTAGSTYHVVARWDTKNTLDGTNYLCVTINDVHDFGRDLAPSDEVTATMYVGGGTYSANAILEGLTVYRRPLFDGTYGIDAGNGDEINLIYAAGAGKKPEEVTGGQDICFQLPTNGSIGEIVTGTGEAHSFPNSSSALTDSFMQTTFGSSAWSASGAVDTGPADIASAANKIFNWGYEWIGDADEGVENSLTGLSAGKNYSIRIIAHEAAGDDLRLTITDDTNTATILSEDFATTDRDAPGVYEITFELPTVARHGVASDCTAITVKILTTANNKTGYVHQCLLIANTVDNPSMEGTYDDESGGGGGTVNIAPGWTANGIRTAGQDTADKETTIVHSGSACQKIIMGQSNGGIIADTNSFLAGNWYLISLMLYATVGSVNIGDINNNCINRSVTPGASFSNYSFIIKAGGTSRLRIKSTGAASYYVDDASIILLDDVSLTGTPASEANSAEGSGIRTDGLDACVEDITGILGATCGKIRFNWTPRHGDGIFEKFAGTDVAWSTILKNTDNFIQLQSVDDVSMTLRMNVAGGGIESVAWDASTIVAGTTYLVEIEYNATKCTCDIDGTERFSITYTGGIDFATNIPDTSYMGSTQTNTQHCDAVFAAPT